MTKNIFIKTKKTDGFSLLEMAVAMAIMVVLTTAIAPVAVRQAQIKAGEKSAREINIIQEAARKYYIDNNSWPNLLEDLKVGGYLNNAWITKNPWGFDYNISSTPSTFSVANQVPPSIVNLLTRTLPSSSNVVNVVTSSIPPPGALSLAPAGVIVAWSGAIADIPFGWLLCDGTNGTPDLRERFIVGARQDLAGVAVSDVTGIMLQQGGTSNHSHGGTTGGHQLSVNEMPTHDHFAFRDSDTNTRMTSSTYPARQYVVSRDEFTDVRGHTLVPDVGRTSSNGGSQTHSHTIAIDSNVPPFYALAFIMKI